MARLEFITGTRIGGMKEVELYDFILDKVNSDSMLVLEKDLDAIEQMSLLARALERTESGIFEGIKTLEISISQSPNGFLRKNKEIKFTLIAPGNSIIDQKEEGIYSIKTENGNSNEIIAFG